METLNIIIKPTLTHEQFGCEIIYFEKYIKNQVLKVIDQYNGNILRVQDDTGEVWTVYEDDYLISNQISIFD